MNGVPACMHSDQINGRMRATWGIDGFVTSDCDALSDGASHRYIVEKFDGKLSTQAQQSLRNLFIGLVATGGGLGPGARFLGLGEFVDFCRAAELIGTDLTERDVTLAFSWSRMCVVDVSDELGRVRDAELQRQAFVKIQKLQAPPAEKQALWEKVEKGIETVLYSDDEMKAVAALRSQVQQALAGMGMAAGHGGGELAGGGGVVTICADSGDAVVDSTGGKPSGAASSDIKCIRLSG